MLRIHGCTRIFVHISKLSWFYLGLLNYWKRKNILIISCNGMAISYHHTLYFIYFLKFLQVWWWIIIIFLGGEWKWLVDESGWWVMTYLLHCSFPIHQFFPSDDWHDCYAEPTTPPFSLQPPPLLPSLPLFFFILARKEGMLTQRGKRKLKRKKKHI